MQSGFLFQNAIKMVPSVQYSALHCLWTIPTAGVLEPMALGSQKRTFVKGALDIFDQYVGVIEVSLAIYLLSSLFNSHSIQGFNTRFIIRQHVKLYQKTSLFRFSSTLNQVRLVIWTIYSHILQRGFIKEGREIDPISYFS